jgi:hypothetical protein
VRAKKRRHERFIVRAGRPVTQLVLNLFYESDESAARITLLETHSHMLGCNRIVWVANSFNLTSVISEVYEKAHSALLRLSKTVQQLRPVAQAFSFLKL